MYHLVHILEGDEPKMANLDSIHTELKVNIAAAQECYQKSTN